MPKLRQPRENMPPLKGGRKRAHLAVHPRIKLELQGMAKAANCSVNVLLNRVIINRWHWQGVEPDLIRVKLPAPAVLPFKRVAGGRNI